MVFLANYTLPGAQHSLPKESVFSPNRDLDADQHSTQVPNTILKGKSVVHTVVRDSSCDGIVKYKCLSLNHRSKG